MSEPDGSFRPGSDFAAGLDRSDPLARFRDAFHVPRGDNGEEEIYFVGNSLGLLPRRTPKYVEEELEKWKRLAVKAHFSGENPWMPYHELLAEPMGRLVGAAPSEVVTMNSLTVNLHLMMASFYRPTRER
ncbi:MAG TPA: kynureninase, partial [Vicinamibacteria bacterium]